jgi:hypothetical protein
MLADAKEDWGVGITIDNVGVTAALAYVVVIG